MPPAGDVTIGEWQYLKTHFADEDAVERRELIVQTLRRLARKGIRHDHIHRALMLGIRLRQEHMNRQEQRAADRRRSTFVKRAQRDVDRALASLRRLMPPQLLDPKVTKIPLTDDMLFSLRDELITAWRERLASLPPERPRRGRPWHWKQEAEEALRQAGVAAGDRQALMSAIGFDAASK